MTVAVQNMSRVLRVTVDIRFIQRKLKTLSSHGQKIENPLRTAECSSRSSNRDFTAWFVNSVILSIPILCSVLWFILKALSNQIQSDQDREIIFLAKTFVIDN